MSIYTKDRYPFLVTWNEVLQKGTLKGIEVDKTIHFTSMKDCFKLACKLADDINVTGYSISRNDK